MNKKVRVINGEGRIKEGIYRYMSRENAKTTGLVGGLFDHYIDYHGIPKGFDKLEIKQGKFKILVYNYYSYVT